MGGGEAHVALLVEFILGGGMSTKVWVVVAAGMMFIPAACAPKSITLNKALSLNCHFAAR